MNTPLNLGTSTQDNASYQNPSMYCTYTNSLTTEDDRALKTLARSISLSKNRFSLTFVRTAYPKAYLLSLLHERYNVVPNTIDIPIEAKQLYPIIQDYWNASDRGLISALSITGLDTVTYLDELLISTNQVRNEFQRHFAVPLIIWVNDEIIQKLVKLAPDFYNWASAPITLGIPHPTRKAS
ncbi:MAG: hypothetical protein F6K16_41370 [Symploca sp. SIO2B6]|nr:hypothetical protein [Symploca sp. SIO2B6]